MPQAHILTFDDPDRFQAMFRAGNYELVDVARGPFHAELTHIDFDRLSLQRSDKDGPSTVHSASLMDRRAIMFLADAEQAAPRRNGMELSARELVVHRPGSGNHLWTSGTSRLAMMSLKHSDFAAAARAITGHDLPEPSHTHLAAPAPEHLTRLRTLYNAACGLAQTNPALLAQPHIAKAIEEELIHAMVDCLAAPSGQRPWPDGGSGRKMIARFEEFLAEKKFEPVYLAEICAAIGASERTLRTHCQEHLGMGPMRYLRLRRMTLARRALLKADAADRTVTDIATEHGFWELGRFSVEYRALFGEAPSVSLRRPPHDLASN